MAENANIRLRQAAIYRERNAPIKPEPIADGTTAPFDPRMFELMKECVDRWLIVPEPRLKAALPEIAATAKVVAEGAGALLRTRSLASSRPRQLLRSAEQLDERPGRCVSCRPDVEPA